MSGGRARRTTRPAKRLKAARPAKAVRASASDVQRCHWASTPDLAEYHDREWGVPVRDDRLMFEHIVLDGAQAGLSWLTILRKREAFRRAHLPQKAADGLFAKIFRPMRRSRP